MSRLDDAFGRIGKAFMPGTERTWEAQWNAKVLRHMNENVWITQNVVERILNGETEQDWKRWESEMAEWDW